MEPDRLPDGVGTHTTERLEVTIGQYSAAGAKSENQDFHGTIEPAGPDRVTKGIAVAIADGISTSQRGAEAAEIAVKSFLTDYYCTSEAWSVQTSAERVISASNSWMHAQNARTRPREEGENRERAALICTFSALVLKSRTAHLFHVGDARIARISEEMLEPLTEPHRVELGGGENYLSRALGADRAVEVDYRQVPLQAGDLFMLSTDGIHEFVGVVRTVELISRAATLTEAARMIAQEAIVNGSDDNLTVQLVRLEALPKGEVDELLGSRLHLPPAPRLSPGQSFEGYEIERELHTGSRSHVYLAHDSENGTRVALKVPATEHAADDAELAALLLEEWVSRRVSHPNLLPAAPKQRSRRHLFSVAAFIEGQTLDQWAANRLPDLTTVRDIVRQIAAGLLALHRREMLHRDLRPRNVMIGPDEQVKIIDFGSVEVAGVNEIAPESGKPASFAGTFQYTAPELFLGEPATPTSDLFSLGVMAYQLLTGTLPYGAAVAGAQTAAAQRRLRYRPACELNPDVPGWVDAALAKAVSIDPMSRYSELSEFVYDLAHPNRGLSNYAPRPLIERGTTSAWRLAAIGLGVALALSILRWPEISLVLH